MVAAPRELIRRTAKRGKSVSANVGTCRAGTNGGKAMEARTVCLVKLNPLRTHSQKAGVQAGRGELYPRLGAGFPRKFGAFEGGVLGAMWKAGRRTKLQKL